MRRHTMINSPIPRYQLSTWLTVPTYLTWLREENGTGMQFSRQEGSSTERDASARTVERVFDPLLIVNQHESRSSDDSAFLPHAMGPRLTRVPPVDLTALNEQTLDFMQRAFKLCVLLQMTPRFLDHYTGRERLLDSIVALVMPVDVKNAKQLRKRLGAVMVAYADQTQAHHGSSRKRSRDEGKTISATDCVQSLFSVLYANNLHDDLIWYNLNAFAIRQFVTFNLDYNQHNKFYNQRVNDDCVKALYAVLVLGSRDDTALRHTQYLLLKRAELTEFYHRAVVFKHPELNPQTFNEWWQNRDCVNRCSARLLDTLQRKHTAQAKLWLDGSEIGYMQTRNSIKKGVFMQQLDIMIETQSCAVNQAGSSAQKIVRHVVVALDAGASMGSDSRGRFAVGERSCWEYQLDNFTMMLNALSQHATMDFELTCYLFAGHCQRVCTRVPVSKINLSVLRHTLSTQRSQPSMGFPTRLTQCITQVAKDFNRITLDAEEHAETQVFLQPLLSQLPKLILFTDGNTAGSIGSIKAAFNRHTMKLLTFECYSARDFNAGVNDVLEYLRRERWSELVRMNVHDSGANVLDHFEKIIDSSAINYQPVRLDVVVKAAGFGKNIVYQNAFYLDGETKKIQLALRGAAATQVNMQVDGEDVAVSSNFLFSRTNLFGVSNTIFADKRKRRKTSGASILDGFTLSA
jgi:hypothetical protein